MQLSCKGTPLGGCSPCLVVHPASLFPSSGWFTAFENNQPPLPGEGDCRSEEWEQGLSLQEALAVARISLAVTPVSVPKGDIFAHVEVQKLERGRGQCL